MAIAKLNPLVKTLNTRTTSKPVERDRSTAAKKERLQVLKRDGYLCVKCKEQGRFKIAEEVDHIVPLCDGGRDTMGNKQSLCRECHRSKTDDEARRRGMGSFISGV